MNFFRYISMVCFLVTLCLTACSGNSAPQIPEVEVETAATTSATPEVSGKAKFISEAQFSTLIMDYKTNPEWSYRGDIPSITTFTASWCGPCKRMAPVFDELAKEYSGKINIYKVDVDQNKELAGFFGIRSVPTLLFARMNGMPALQPGAMSKEQLVEVIETFLLKTE